MPEDDQEDLLKELAGFQRLKARDNGKNWRNWCLYSTAEWLIRELEEAMIHLLDT